MPQKFSKRHKLIERNVGSPNYSKKFLKVI